MDEFEVSFEINDKASPKVQELIKGFGDLEEATKTAQLATQVFYESLKDLGAAADTAFTTGGPKALSAAVEEAVENTRELARLGADIPQQFKDQVEEYDTIMRNIAESTSNVSKDLELASEKGDEALQLLGKTLSDELAKVNTGIEAAGPNMEAALIKYRDVLVNGLDEINQKLSGGQGGTGAGGPTSGVLGSIGSAISSFSQELNKSFIGTGASIDAWQSLKEGFQSIPGVAARAHEELMAVADSLTDMSARTQVSTDALQEFDFIGKQAGVSMRELANSAVRITRAIEGNSASTAKSLGKIGLSIKDLRGLPPDEVITRIVTSLNKIEDAAARVRAASELFGPKLGPALLSLGGDLEKLREQARAAGIVLSNETLVAADDLGDAITRLEITTSKFQQKLVSGFSSNKLIKESIDYIQEGVAKLSVAFDSFAGNPAGEALREIFGTIAVGSSMVASKVPTIITSMGAMGDALIFLENVSKRGSESQGLLSFWDKLKGIGSADIGSKLKSVATGIKSGAGSLLESIGNMLKPAQAAPGLGDLLKGAGDAGNAAAGASGLKGIMESFKNFNWKAVKDGFASMGASIKEIGLGVKANIVGAFTSAIEPIAALISKVGALKLALASVGVVAAGIFGYEAGKLIDEWGAKLVKYADKLSGGKGEGPEKLSDKFGDDIGLLVASLDAWSSGRASASELFGTGGGEEGRRKLKELTEKGRNVMVDIGASHPDYFQQFVSSGGPKKVEAAKDQLQDPVIVSATNEANQARLDIMKAASTKTIEMQARIISEESSLKKKQIEEAFKQENKAYYDNNQTNTEQFQALLLAKNTKLAAIDAQGFEQRKQLLKDFNRQYEDEMRKGQQEISNIDFVGTDFEKSQRNIQQQHDESMVQLGRKLDDLLQAPGGVGSQDWQQTIDAINMLEDKTRALNDQLGRQQLEKFFGPLKEVSYDETNEFLSNLVNVDWSKFDSQAPAKALGELNTEFAKGAVNLEEYAAALKIVQEGMAKSGKSVLGEGQGEHIRNLNKMLTDVEVGAGTASLDTSRQWLSTLESSLTDIDRQSEEYKRIVADLELLKKRIAELGKNPLGPTEKEAANSALDQINKVNGGDIAGLSREALTSGAQAMASLIVRFKGNKEVVDQATIALKKYNDELRKLEGGGKNTIIDPNKWKGLTDVASVLGSLGLALSALGGEKVGAASGALSAIPGIIDNAKQSTHSWKDQVQAVAAGFAQIWSASEKTRDSVTRTMQGMTAGAQAGAQFGPWGAAIGAAVGGLVAFFHGPKWAATATEASKLFGFKVSDELAKAIYEAQKKFKSLNTGETSLLFLDKALAESGKPAHEFTNEMGALADLLNNKLKPGSEEAKTAIEALRNSLEALGEENIMGLLKFVEGLKPGSEAAKVGIEALGNAFSKLADAAMKSSSVGTKALTEFIQTARAAGIQIAEVTAFVQDKLKIAREGVNKMVEGLTTGFGSGAGSGINVVRKKIENLKNEYADLNLELEKGTKRAKEYEKKMKELRDELGQAKKGAGGTGGITAKNALAQAAIFANVFWATVAEEGILVAAREMGESFDKLKQVFADLGVDASALFDPIESIVNLGNDPRLSALIEGIDGARQALEGLSAAGYLTYEAFSGFQTIANETYQQLRDNGVSERDALIAIGPYLADLKRAHEEYGIALDGETQKLIDQYEAQVGAFKADPVKLMTDAIHDLIDSLRELNGLPPIDWGEKFTGQIPAPPTTTGSGGGGENGNGTGEDGYGHGGSGEHAASGAVVHPTLGGRPVVMGDTMQTEVAAPVNAILRSIGNQLADRLGAGAGAGHNVTINGVNKSPLDVATEVIKAISLNQGQSRSRMQSKINESY